MPQYDAMGNATGFTEEIPETPPKVEEKKEDKKECETCKDGEWTDKDGKKHKVETLEDGTKIHTVTSPDGSTTTTTTSPNGSSQTVSTGPDGKTGTSTVQNRDGSKEVTEYKGDGQYEQKSYNAKGEVVASNTRGEDGATVTKTMRTDGSDSVEDTRIQRTDGRVVTTTTEKSDGWIVDSTKTREVETAADGRKLYDGTTETNEYGIKDYASVSSTKWSGDRVGAQLEGKVMGGELAEAKLGASAQWYDGKLVGGHIVADQSIAKGGFERIGGGAGGIRDISTGSYTAAAEGRFDGFFGGAGMGGTYTSQSNLNGVATGTRVTGFVEGPFGAGAEGALARTNGSWNGGFGGYLPGGFAENYTYGTGGGLMGVTGSEKLAPSIF